MNHLDNQRFKSDSLGGISDNTELISVSGKTKALGLEIQSAVGKLKPQFKEILDRMLIGRISHKQIVSYTLPFFKHRFKSIRSLENRLGFEKLYQDVQMSVWVNKRLTKLFGVEIENLIIADNGSDFLAYKMTPYEKELHDPILDINFDYRGKRGEIMQILNSKGGIFYVGAIRRIGLTTLVREAIDASTMVVYCDVNYKTELNNPEMSFEDFRSVLDRRVKMNNNFNIQGTIFFDDFQQLPVGNQEKFIQYLNRLFQQGYCKRIIIGGKRLYEKVAVKSSIPELVINYFENKCEQGSSIYDDKIEDNMYNQNFIVINGPVGSGKSTLINYVLNDKLREYFNNSPNVIPFFFNARDFIINDGSIEIHSIRNLLTQKLEDFGKENGIECSINLNSFSICLFIDGLDEVDISISKNIEKELNGIGKSKHNLVVILSRQLEHHDYNQWDISAKYGLLHELENDDKISLLGKYLENYVGLEIVNDKIRNDYYISNLCKRPGMLVNFCHYIKANVKDRIITEDIFNDLSLGSIYRGAIDYILVKHEGFKGTDNFTKIQLGKEIFYDIAWLSINNQNSNSITERQLCSSITRIFGDANLLQIKEEILRSSLIHSNGDNTYSFLSLSYREFWLAEYYLKLRDGGLSEILSIRDNNQGFFYSDTFKQTLVLWFDMNGNNNQVNSLIRDIGYLNCYGINEFANGPESLGLPFDTLERKSLFFLLNIFEQLSDTLIDDDSIQIILDEILILTNIAFCGCKGVRVESIFIKLLFINSPRYFFKMLKLGHIEMRLDIEIMISRLYSDKLFNYLYDFITDKEIDLSLRTELLTICGRFNSDSARAELLGNLQELESVGIDDHVFHQPIPAEPKIFFSNEISDDYKQSGTVSLCGGKMFSLDQLEDLFSNSNDIDLRLEYLFGLISINPRKYVNLALKELGTLSMITVNAKKVIDLILEYVSDDYFCLEGIETMFFLLNTFDEKLNLLLWAVNQNVSCDELVMHFFQENRGIGLRNRIDLFPILIGNYYEFVEATLGNIINHEPDDLEGLAEMGSKIASHKVLVDIVLKLIETNQVVGNRILIIILISAFDLGNFDRVKYFRFSNLFGDQYLCFFDDLFKNFMKQWPKNFFEFFDPFVYESAIYSNVNDFLEVNEFNFTMDSFIRRFEQLSDYKAKYNFYLGVRQLLNAMLGVEENIGGFRNLEKFGFPIKLIYKRVSVFNDKFIRDFESSPELKLCELISKGIINSSKGTSSVEFFNNHCQIKVIGGLSSIPGGKLVEGEENAKYMWQVYKLVDEIFGLESVGLNDLGKDTITEKLGAKSCKVYVVLVGEVVVSFNITFDILGPKGEKVFYSYLLGSHPKFHTGFRLIDDFMQNILEQEGYAYGQGSVDPFGSEMTTYFRHNSICREIIRRSPDHTNSIAYYPEGIHVDRLLMEFHHEVHLKGEKSKNRIADIYISLGDHFEDFRDKIINFPEQVIDNYTGNERKTIIGIKIKKFVKNQAKELSEIEVNTINNNFDFLAETANYLFENGYYIFSYSSGKISEYYFRKY